MSSNAASGNNPTNAYAKVILKPQQTLPEVLKFNKCKQIHASRLDEFSCRVNLMLNYYDFNCAINSIFCMVRKHSEVINCSLDIRFEVKAKAEEITLHLCESWHKREINAQSMGFQFMIGGALALANENR